MISQNANPLTYFQYNPNQYNLAFQTSFEYCLDPPVTTNPTPAFNPADFFQVSPVDNETVIPKSNRQMQPVFDKPIYTPFGLGYRRCAGEIFVYLVTLKIFEKFQVLFNDPQLSGDTRFEFRVGVYPPITPAPFTFVPDNIFVKPQVPTQP